MSIDLQAYLDRIGYRGATQPSHDNLRALHRTHMLAVPFENLDIHVGRWIVLDEAKLFAKIVGERRGGFCFEQNGLFHAVLSALGYEVMRVAAEVHRGAGVYSIPKAHMALIVTLDDERRLVDVGFGDSFLEPLQLDTERVQPQGAARYKITQDGDTGYYWAQGPEGDWEVQYRFGFAAHDLTDFDNACHHMQTSPQTHFTQKRICSLATETGRLSLSDLKLIERVDGERTERLLASEGEAETILRERFGVDLTTAKAQATRF